MVGAEVVWSGSIERDAIRAQQRRIEPEPTPTPRVVYGPRKHILSLRRICLAALMSRPGVYLSAPELAERIGEDRRRVSHCLGALAQDGMIRTEHSNARVGRRKTQRYGWRA